MQPKAEATDFAAVRTKGHIFQRWRTSKRLVLVSCETVMGLRKEGRDENKKAQKVVNWPGEG